MQEPCTVKSFRNNYFESHFYFALRTGIRVKGALSDLVRVFRGWHFLHAVFYFFLLSNFSLSCMLPQVYRKAIRLSTVKSLGTIVNLISNDAQRVPELFVWFNILWGSPAQVIAVTTLLYLLFGWEAFLGMAVILLFFGSQFGLAKVSQKNAKSRDHHY